MLLLARSEATIVVGAFGNNTVKYSFGVALDWGQRFAHYLRVRPF